MLCVWVRANVLLPLGVSAAQMIQSLSEELRALTEDPQRLLEEMQGALTLTAVSPPVQGALPDLPGDGQGQSGAALASNPDVSSESPPAGGVAAELCEGPCGEPATKAATAQPEPEGASCEAAEAAPLTRGTALIAAERRRQITQEGWTPEHDDEYQSCELTAAAHCYMEEAAQQVLNGHAQGDFPTDWPWSADWWKSSPDPVRNLVKAGALIAAEIDRLLRAAEEGGAA